jgi:hypothetical protein
MTFLIMREDNKFRVEWQEKTMLLWPARLKQRQLLYLYQFIGQIGYGRAKLLLSRDS